jgi:hypothetical protein
MQTHRERTRRIKSAKPTQVDIFIFLVVADSLRIDIQETVGEEDGRINGCYAFRIR